MSNNSAIKQEKRRDKSYIICVTTLVLLMTFAVSLITVPVASAHDPPWTISTFAFISVEPNPVGIGQTTYVNFWIDKVPPTAEGNWGYKWHNMTVTMTKPDGHTQILGPFDSDAVGGAWTSFVPDQLGTYTFVGNFPTQTAVEENPYPYPISFDIGAAFINDTYTASTSKEVTLVVQQQQIETNYPPNPLPTGYWQRPINSMNRNWASIGGNWFGLGATSFGDTGLYESNGNFNPYTTAPNSAHVIWTKPETFGGQIGGEFGDSETSLYATGTAYEAKFGAVILNGILYYTDYPGAANNKGPLTALDLRTGQTVWTVNASNPLKCGMIYNFITGDQYGGHAYLFTAPGRQGFIIGGTPNVWSMYDAVTGQWILDIANATAGTLVEGPRGELLSYRTSGGMFSLWNASKCIAAGSTENLSYQVYSSAEIWRPPQGATIDWNGGNEWSVPVANTLSGEPISLGLSKVSYSDNVAVLTQMDTSTPGRASPGWSIDAGYSMTDGSLLWGPINRTQTPWAALYAGPAGEGVYTMYNKALLTWTAYDIKTGQKLWDSVPKNVSWGYYESANGVIGYGNLYSWGLGGEVYCYDLQTGNVKWLWSAGSAGVDSPFGTWPLGTWQTHHILADGKIYVRAGHDYTPPVFKGAKLYCIDAYNGHEVWSSLSFDIVSSPAVADGIMLWFNGYDNQIYAYGQGLTATTVSASPGVGNAITIQGTVTDQSPGQTCLGIPAAGTPAISDASMSAWMEYLYQQQPKPTDATGVQVRLTAVQPGGNTEEIGTVSSDSNGHFGMMWTPSTTGYYTIVASFEGSNSYYSSTGETGIAVGTANPTAQPASPSPTEAVQPPTSQAPTATYIAIAIAVIVIIALAAVILLRRRR